MNGIGLISQERQRQVTQEGWTPEHDDEHVNGELAIAAAVYATPANIRIVSAWPFDDGFKPTPTDRIRELVKAAALIAAEIDRLQRASSWPPVKDH